MCSVKRRVSSVFSFPPSSGIAIEAGIVRVVLLTEAREILGLVGLCDRDRLG